MSKTCPRCSAVTNDDSIFFCRSCGKSLSQLTIPKYPGIIQDLNFETNSIDRFSKMLQTCIEITECNYLYYHEEDEHLGYAVAQYPSYTTAYMMDYLGHPSFTFRPSQTEQTPKHYWQICYLSRTEKSLANQIIKFKDSDEAVQSVLGLLQKIDKIRIREQLGQGSFEGYDGLVKLGYRLVSSSSSNKNRSRDILEVALCLIYLSK